MKRIYHTWDKWECYPAGFYESKHPTLDDETCRNEYAKFLRDIPRFYAAAYAVLALWPRSCEHYLSNENMNRIAWIGQSAMCYDTGIPAVYRGGFMRLTPDEQAAANECALGVLNFWLRSRGEKQLTMTEAQSKTEANLY